MTEYTVTLTHKEEMTVEAQDEAAALQIAYQNAKWQGLWDEAQVEVKDSSQKYIFS